MLLIKFKSSLQHWPQVVAVLSATCGSISDGMTHGWSSPSVPKLQQEDSTIHITQADIEWFDSINMIGGLCSLPFIWYFPNKIGRKRSLILLGLINVCAWLLIVFGTRVEYFYVARFLSGLVISADFMCITMYVSEIAHQSIRGSLGSIIHVMFHLGILLVYATGPIMTLAETACIGIFIIGVQIVSVAIMPESPYYLLWKNKPEEARKCLQWLRYQADTKEEFTAIKEAVVRQSGESGRLLDMFVVSSNRKAVLIMLALHTFVNFGGKGVILMHVHNILGDVHDLVTTYQAGIIFGAVMLVSSVVSTSLMDHFGRRGLLITSSITTGLCLWLIAIYLNVSITGKLTGFSWIPALAVILYAISYGLGLGQVPVVMNGELYSSKVKAFGMTLGEAAYVSTALIVLNVYHTLNNHYGMFVPFYVFGGCCMISAVFSAVYVPETKGKTLEEIQMILKR